MPQAIGLVAAMPKRDPGKPGDKQPEDRSLEELGSARRHGDLRAAAPPRRRHAPQITPCRGSSVFVRETECDDVTREALIRHVRIQRKVLVIEGQP